jgi:hypothetical protein
MIFQKIVLMLALLLGAMVFAVEGQHTIRATNTMVSSVGQNPKLRHKQAQNKAF